MKEITKAFLFSVLLCAALACSMLIEPTDHGTVEPMEMKIIGTEDNPIVIGNDSFQYILIQDDTFYGVPFDE